MIDELDYYHEVDLPIFRQEFAEWLPDKVFDIHTHSWLREHLKRPLSEERSGVVFESESESWEDLASDYNLLFPGKVVERLTFALPMTVINRQANNDYVASHIDNNQNFGLFIPGLEDSASSIADAIHQGGFIGIKPYMSFVTWKELEAIRITDFLLPPQLEVANEYGLIIMLHIPRNGRLADPDNLADIKMIARKYPRAQIILAHAGRAFSRTIMEYGLNSLGDLPNIYFDLSNVQDAVVINTLLVRYPLTHILYGTDIPMATMRGLMLMINKQRVIITRKRFPWSISSERPGQLRCTFMGYEGLRAVKQACEDLGLGREAINAIFYDNSRTLVMQAAQIYR